MRAKNAPARPTRVHQHAVVRESNEIAFQTNPLPSSLFPANRSMAMSRPMYLRQSNAITGKYDRYPGMYQRPIGKASVDAAAVMGADCTCPATSFLRHIQLTGVQPNQRRDQSLAAIPDGQSKTDGIAVGMAVQGSDYFDQSYR